MIFVPCSSTEKENMETITLGDWKVVVRSCETMAPAGHLAAANLDAESIHSLMPYVYEVANRHFKDAISSIEESTQTTVRIIFTLREMESEHMIVLVKTLIKQAIRLHEERQNARSRRADPSNPDGLVVVNPDRYHRAPKSPFTNVPTRVRRK